MVRKNLVYFVLFARPAGGGGPAWYPDDYLDQLALCLRSLAHTSDPASFDLLLVADQAHADRLRELPELSAFTHRVLLFRVPPDLCLAMCTRYMIHALMGEDLSRYEKVLYLDADVVFLRGVDRLFERVTDPSRLYVKPDAWGGARVDSPWYALDVHTEEEAARFEAERVRVWNSGTFAFVVGPAARALLGELCVALPSLVPRSRGLDQPVANSFLRRRHLSSPCLDQDAIDPLVHLATPEAGPRPEGAVIVHFIKDDKLARMREEVFAAAPPLTFVTTCRGRLAHLQQSLPTFAAQPGTACVVVDYGCPERSGDWAERSFPAVRVVRAPDAQRFELARARNLGAAAALSRWICFIDADIRLAPDFADRVVPALCRGSYYQALPRDMETWGTSISAREDFDRVGGYDEVLQGWGKDDDDYYARLEIAGVRPATFPGELIRPLRHDDGARTAHYEEKDRWVSESINHVYCRAKIDLSLLRRAPVPLELRRRLYDQVRSAVLEGRRTGAPAFVTLQLPAEETRVCGPIEPRITYALPRPRGDGAPSPRAGSVIRGRPPR